MVVATEGVGIQRCNLDQQAFGAERDLQTFDGGVMLVERNVHTVFVRIAGHEEHPALVAVAAQGGHVVFFIIARGGEEQGGGQLHGGLDQ
ncbi:hypothetical protein D3C72_1700430 [compost metagenome]